MNARWENLEQRTAADDQLPEIWWRDDLKVLIMDEPTSGSEPSRKSRSLQDCERATRRVHRIYVSHEAKESHEES